MNSPVAFLRRVLSPGSRLALLAPSGPFDVDSFERGVERLRTRYEVRYDESIFARRGYFAGDDAQRLQVLERALSDPQIDALVAARGGYGATRLLPYLEVERVRRANKLLVGFSDITALHALWARAGLGSIHGSMVAKLGQCESPLFERWTRSLEGARPASLGGLSQLAPGRARGRLLGGNLAVLSALLGTGFAPPLDDSILFLEDVGERPYRVDRMLTSMAQAGWLDRVSGVALGAFSQCDPGPDGTTVEQVLAERLGPRGLPVVAGVPAGHVDDNLELPLGEIVTLDADAGTLAFEDA